jgi:hypothetical protein
LAGAFLAIVGLILCDSNKVACHATITLNPEFLQANVRDSGRTAIHDRGGRSGAHREAQQTRDEAIRKHYAVARGTKTASGMAMTASAVEWRWS